MARTSHVTVSQVPPGWEDSGGTQYVATVTCYSYHYCCHSPHLPHPGRVTRQDPMYQHLQSSRDWRDSGEKDGEEPFRRIPGKTQQCAKVESRLFRNGWSL